MNPDESRVDQALLGQAQQVLGTTTAADTLDLALSIAITQTRHTDAVARELARFTAGHYAGLASRGGQLGNAAPVVPAVPGRGRSDHQPAGHLVDTSALARAGQPAVSRLLHGLLQAQTATTCPLIELEVLALARSATEYDELARGRQLAYRSVPLSPAIGVRMAELGGLLARAGHRAVLLPAELLVAATAMEHDLRLVHHCPVFALLAELSTLDQLMVGAP